MRALTASLLIGTLLAAQDDPLRDVRDLLDKLRSDRIEERDEAIRKLEEKGKRAAPLLQEFLTDPDAEVRQRARRTLDEIDRRERIRAFREPGKRVSVEVKNASLSEATRSVFGQFQVRSRIEPGTQDLGIVGVTLSLRDSAFWKAVDSFVEAARVSPFDPEFPFPLRPACRELVFASPFLWLHRWDTVGDARIFARPVTMGGQGDVTARLSVAFAPWAVPDKARVEDVTLAGHPVRQEEGFRIPELLREDEKISVAVVWSGADAVKRNSLKGAESVALEGVLVLIRGKETVRLPFMIRDMPVPPFSKR